MAPPPVPSGSLTDAAKARKSKSKGQVRHWKVETPDDGTFSLKECEPARVLDIMWKDVDKVMRSEDGAAGVLFVRLEPKQSKGGGAAIAGTGSPKPRVVVLKASSTTAQELFGNRVAEVLGVR